MLGIQERAVLSWLQGVPGASLLDVGGGHGQLAVPLAARGFKVTVAGSAPAAARGVRAEAEAGRLRFVEANLLRLPFSDRAFDAALCIRLLPHCPPWRDLVAQLCRVSRSAVIVDYPTARSVNAFSGLLFGAKRRIEGNTRPYALFRDSEVSEAFARHGFRVRRRCRQFFFPMALHRLLHVPGLSACLESAARALRLTACFGSPVLVEMVRT
jgi:2-polyprenyl-3-methyl-5-hydroxy-6-metoxy-1,4-benzoquinol methylase